MMRIALLKTTVWAPAVLLSAAAGFVLGYLFTQRAPPHAHEETEVRVVDLVAAEAVARTSGEYARRTTGEVIWRLVRRPRRGASRERRTTDHRAAS